MKEFVCCLHVDVSVCRCGSESKRLVYSQFELSGHSGLVLYHRLIFSLFIPPQDRQKERERRAREMMMGGVIPFLQLCSHKYNWKRGRGKRERESRMVFDAIWLAVLLQSKRQIQLCCFFGVPRVSSHIAESPMRSTTRVCGVYVCLRSHKRWGVGVCVCWGGCLGFHSLAAPYTVRTHQRWRERERGWEGWMGRKEEEERQNAEVERMHWQFHASPSWKAPTANAGWQVLNDRDERQL